MVRLAGFRDSELEGSQLSAGASAARAPRACLNMEHHGEDVPSGALHANVACDTAIGVGWGWQDGTSCINGKID